MTFHIPKLIFFFLLIIPISGFSQSEYDLRIIGTWTGTISGAGLATKNITIVITKSNYQNHDANMRGVCEGYSTVNNGNKTFFKGNIIVEADMPIIDVKEPTTSQKNGKFYLMFGCLLDTGIDSELCCGTWTSYDKTLNRKIEARKK